MSDEPLPGGKLIANDHNNFHLIFYPDGVHAGRVIGWSRQFDDDGQPLQAWKPIDFGTPFEAIIAYPGLKQQLLQAATGEL
jgi:hypothetical protein